MNFLQISSIYEIELKNNIRNKDTLKRPHLINQYYVLLGK